MGTQSPGTVQKTRHMLAGALMRLLEKRSFRKISVGDICREAMVSRSAFYMHYADKYELLSDTMDELLRLKSEEGRGRTLEQQMTELLENIQTDQRMFHNMFMADLSQEMLDIFTGTFESVVRERLRQLERAGVYLPGPIPMVASFYAGGLANVVMSWIRENLQCPRRRLRDVSAGC